ncbi:hypothetical protein VSR01_21655 [Actinacidiphila sp. DG2A-62]|uniref:hypothetical protein n=1 Tax=Actinacidiphila sp. DG2A-62 TaxID=3108821 RepID=UPI002DBE4A9B|nr:hypothetical protein [Actinacidiphila sp. DG2A-62]MEC3995984.1 hypothetical protein [Actinacidiphila sp. DG2A-62]
MPDLSRPRALVFAAAAGLVVALVPAADAAANEIPSQGHNAGSHDHTLDASAYAVTYEPAEPPAGHPIGAVSGWTPPACWVAPVAKPEELKAEREAVWAEGSPGPDWVAGQKDYYVNGHPHKDFEIANSGKGFWWDGQVNPNRRGDPASLTCFKERDDWVPTGDRPPAGPVVTPEILAESAYDRVRIPDKVVNLSPDALHTQTVNVNIWAWLDSADIPPVSVTARLNSLGIWATTTATPVGLHLDAGTPYAERFPASGDCPIAEDGSVGERYQPRDGNTVLPPCGLVYRKSSDGGTYTLTATIRWRVTWKGSGGTGGRLDDGVFDLPQQVTVKEYQAVNR